MVGLAFLELFVLLSTFPIILRFSPAPGFYECCVPAHAWAAALQTPGSVAGQYAAHHALLVALCSTIIFFKFECVNFGWFLVIRLVL